MGRSRCSMEPASLTRKFSRLHFERKTVCCLVIFLTSFITHLTCRLIWNLDRTDRSAIQLILSKHYRSITDVNWHNHHPDIVASTGIDSWIWVWDLRTAVKPVAGVFILKVV